VPLCVLQAAEALAALVAAHDVVFLLTDTRESRWLPTLLAAAAGKVAITAALGFDTFLVMRHGLPPPPAAADAPPGGADACAQAGSHPFQQQQQQQQQQQHSEQQHRLGCYFCNDVVAPLNSTIDRTLDQQCTVARPGLAPIAGALAVELMAALLQHPARGRAPAPSAGGGRGAAGAAPAAASRAGAPPAAAAAAAGGALGHVPHMVRGQLSGFGQVCMAGQAFSQCTACSPAVLQQHAREGWSFLARVLQQPGCLEELTGLAELHRQAAALDLGGGSDAGSDEGGAGGGGSGSDSDADWAQL
jgi:ubiquitin-like modifier-activating enzyme ATG7